ncbi:MULTISPECIES: hypothetical protein [unclassified Thermosipho (in: thermotogales)]|uniref:hypothetical protein n=1 Tax=unclassified Thermosipho (in: thermotogales) TaxID=2676525 RepID=UPI000985B5C3|nr:MULTISPECIES: hypothetical protein [unclassified Thermosipho (in: thermotogales)]MBT1247952.1 hypothetical protein [Thermosipho sp. 1244]OOC46553.1 hypothetical protein XO09_05235 [Thermosipho sp. 1223]
MKKIIFITIIALLFVFWSCGIVPKKLPNTLSIKLTKHVEFPITTMNFSIPKLIDPLLDKLNETGFYISKDNPITLTYATSIEFSPGKMIDEISQNITKSLSDVATSLSFSFSVDNITALNTQQEIQLPTIQDSSDNFNLTSINIGDITLFSTSIYVDPAYPNATVEISFSTDKFSSINIYESILSINKTSSEVDPSKVELEIIINGTKYTNNDIISNLTVRNGDKITLVATYTGTNSGNVNINTKLLSVKINKGTGLNIENVNINPSLSPIIIDDQNSWMLKLSGTLDTSFSFDATNLNIDKEIVVKSGSTIVAQGNPLTFDNTKTIDAKIPLNIDATLTLYGNNVDIDLTQPISYNVIPNITIESIYNYPVNLEQYISLPSEILESEIGTGTLYIEFLGLSSVDATGLITDGTSTHNITSINNSLAIDLSNICLPATFNLNYISGNVDNNVINIKTSLSDDFEIRKAKISNSLLTSAYKEISYEIPQQLKDYLNTVDATILIQFDYNATNVSDLTLKIQSNFFENKDIYISNSGSTTISNTTQTIDFSTLNNISITVDATGNPIITNIKKNESYGIDIFVSIAKFELDNFIIKNQEIEVLPKTTLLDFSTNKELELIKNLESNISMPIEFKATDTTIDATVSLLVSGNLVKLQLGEMVNIGPILSNLIKNASPITISASLTTDNGILNQNSVFGFDAIMNLPLSGTPLVDTPILEENFDISDLRDLVDILDTATLTFNQWKNTTGLTAKLKILNKEITIGESTPVISFTHEDFVNLLEPSTISILLPKDEYIQINKNGIIDISPYIIIDLTVATKVSFEGRE